MNRGPLLVVSAVVVVAVTVNAVNSAFFVGTSTLEVTVPENIQFPRTFEVVLDPNDVFFWVVPITNTGQAESAIDLRFTVEPAGGKVSIGSVESLIVPATSTVDVAVEVEAANDIEPGTYTISLEVKRSGG